MPYKKNSKFETMVWFIVVYFIVTIYITISDLPYIFVYFTNPPLIVMGMTFEGWIVLPVNGIAWFAGFLYSSIYDIAVLLTNANNNSVPYGVMILSFFYVLFSK